MLFRQVRQKPCWLLERFNCAQSKSLGSQGGDVDLGSESRVSWRRSGKMLLRDWPRQISLKHAAGSAVRSRKPPRERLPLANTPSHTLSPYTSRRDGEPTFCHTRQHSLGLELYVDALRGLLPACALRGAENLQLMV